MFVNKMMAIYLIKSRIIFNSELGDLSKKQVTINISSLNFEIYRLSDKLIFVIKIGTSYIKSLTPSKTDTKKAIYLYVKKNGFEMCRRPW